MRLNILTLLLLLTLNGCVQVFPPAKKSDTLLITADFAKSLTLPIKAPQNWHMVIPQPSINAYIEKKQVMVEDQSGTVRYLSGVHWPDDLPDFFQSLLVDSLNSTQYIKGVSESSRNITPKHVLQLDINKFHILKDTQDTYRTTLEIVVQLIDFKTRKLITSTVFTASEPLTSTNNLGLRNSFTHLTKAFVSELIPWASKKIG